MAEGVRRSSFPGEARETYDDASSVRSRRSLSTLAELIADRNRAVQAFGMTDIGCVRGNNEDHFLIAELERSLLLQQTSLGRHDGTNITGNPQGRLFMVADGMGGHEGGEIASQIAIEAMARYAFALMPWLLQASQSSEDELTSGLRRAMRDAHARVREAAAERELDSRMGTTLTMAYVTWPELYVVHAGDSRCYLLRDEKLHRLTHDHTFAQQLVERHAMSAEEAERSRFRHMLVNAVGGGSPDITSELHHVRLFDGDQLLLCSDGLTGQLLDEQIRGCLLAGGSVESVVKQLIATAKASGGDDNITAVLARF
ncbi:MAG TPA: protein phosphatase 2C domain-containing protein [Polyangiaceae bacterium]|nr:protein phosphatase 2C domain-containing protein [Polyangiaceae bacterium]